MNDTAPLTSASKLFAGTADFMLGVAAPTGLPPIDRPEFAFAGRSNVGKSSLLNALTNRKALARTSHTPGRTQELNFFNIADTLTLVDMPGYGYAKVSKKERARWEGLVRSYLKGRPTLRCCFILIDGRHGLKETDIDLMKMLDETAVPYRLLMTKADKVKKTEREKIEAATQAILKKHPAAFPEILWTSANEKTGLENVQQAVLGLL